MGKSPGKWIKNLLLGKKSSKSSPSKGREVLKSSNKVEQLVSSTKLSVSNVTTDAPIVSPPLAGTIAGKDVGSENQAPANLQTDHVVQSDLKEGGSESTQAAICSVTREDPDRIRLERAAIKAQAAFRGYAARREFQTLKCAVTLQAQARGHLVRRQAVSTLCCVKGIVKLQELVRARKGATVFNSLGGSTSAKVKRLSKNAFAFKLRASLPGAIPLRLQYSPDEPNSASLWLERWTQLLFWEPSSEPRKNSNSKPRKKNESSRTVEAEQDRSKRSARRLSGSNVENGSLSSTLDIEKGKRIPKKVSGHTVNTLQEQSPNEIEKVKRGSRKTSEPAKEISDRLMVENGKPKHRMRKSSGSPAPTVSEQSAGESAEKLKDTREQGKSDPTEKLQDIPEASPKQSDLEKGMELPNTPADKLQCQSPLVLQPMEIVGKAEDIQELNQDLGCKDDCMNGDNQRPNERRASLPAKFDPQDNGVHNTPKLPSYMAPTESAKAKLRAQGSPRLARDVAEKNALLRRHSLSSSTNSMFSTTLSPRAHKLVQATGKGVLRGDRSFSSSRDGGDKLIQAEWRR